MESMSARMPHLIRRIALIALLCAYTSASAVSENAIVTLNIPRGSLLASVKQFSEQTGIQVTANFGSPEEQDQPVTELRGQFRADDALRLLFAGTNLRAQWEGDGTVHVYPRKLPRGPGGNEMTVTSTRLESLQGSAPKVAVLDREQIEATGASSIPELLQHLPQTAFNRGLGFRTSGAQYAELRGLGAGFTKIMINGRPTFGTAADIFESGTDLNVVPLSAVERIEITTDAISLAHGADAIGGLVNIVLRESADQIADVQYESANGGASAYRGAIIAGFQSDASSASIVLDYSRTTPLFGAARDRWRNQDWTQHGGTDHRTLNSSPPNVRSTNGDPLPGLSSSFAAVHLASGSPVFLDGEQNRSSLLAWQSIVPDLERMSLSAIGHYDIGSTSLSSELLVSQRTALYQFGPEVISGTLGAQHPQNPFGTPVSVTAALTGLPPAQQETASTLLRGVLAATGSIGRRGSYETSLLHTSDSAEVTSRNRIDPFKVLEGLSGRTATPLNVMSDAPGEGGENLLAPRRTQNYLNGATQISARANGPIWQLPTGGISAAVGMDARREFAEFSQVKGKLERDVISGYASIKVPLAVGLTAEYGLRRDNYEDVSSVTSHQYIVRWKPAETLRLHASHGDAFSPPSFWELRFPRTVVRGVPMFDPKRNEAVPITLLTGGNEDLRPAIGRVSSVGVRFGAEDSSFASLSLWDVEVKDRNSLVPPLVVLAHEDTAISGRVVREQPSAEDVANSRVGRLSALDISRANFGSTKTQGIDLTLAARLRPSFGSFYSQLDVSYTDQFQVTDLPTTDSPEHDRTGIASDFGTITAWRLRGMLSATHRDLTATLLARFNSCYQDFPTAQGQLSGRTICPGLSLDAHVTKELSEHIRLTIGASDVYTSSVPWAANAVGFDTSQRDLTGPTGYVGISIKL